MSKMNITKNLVKSLPGVNIDIEVSETNHMMFIDVDLEALFGMPEIPYQTYNSTQIKKLRTVYQQIKNVLEISLDNPSKLEGEYNLIENKWEEVQPSKIFNLIIDEYTPDTVEKPIGIFQIEDSKVVITVREIIADLDSDLNPTGTYTVRGAWEKEFKECAVSCQVRNKEVLKEFFMG